MSKQEEKIIASIKAHGWFTREIYFNYATLLLKSGVIERGDRYFTGGNRKPVWVAGPNFPEIV